MKRTILFVLLIIMFVSFVSCKRQQPVQKSLVSLKVWIMPNTEVSDKDFLDVIKPFSDENPNINVTVSVIDWADALRKIRDAASGASEAPDIVQLGTTWIADISSTGGLANIKDKYNEQDFIEASIKSIKIPGSNGVTAMPWFVDTRIIYYRKDICSKAGVNPEKDFATWSSFKNALKKINRVKINGKRIAAFGMPAGNGDWNVIHNFSWWIWGAGGDFLESNTKKTAINSPESLEGIKFYMDLAAEGLMSIDALSRNTTETQDMFCNEDSFAVTIDDASLIDVIRMAKAKDPTNYRVDNIGAVIIPTGPKGKYSFLGGSVLSIMKSTNNFDSAVKLLNYLGSKDAQIKYSKISGYLPAARAIYDDPFIVNDPLRSVFKETLKYGRSYPSIPEWGICEENFKTGFSNIWLSIVTGKYNAIELTEEINRTAENIDSLLSSK